MAGEQRSEVSQGDMQSLFRKLTDFALSLPAQEQIVLAAVLHRDPGQSADVEGFGGYIYEKWASKASPEFLIRQQLDRIAARFAAAGITVGPPSIS